MAIYVYIYKYIIINQIYLIYRIIYNKRGNGADYKIV